MITFKLGKIFCELYNETNNTNMSPKDIFKNVITPLLFGTEPHLVCWTNSKFSNPSTKKNPFEENLDKFCSEVESETGGLMDTLKVYGGCAVPYNTATKKYKSNPQTTSFCYEENQYFNIDERYYSWIGGAFLIGIGGYCIAVNDKEFVKTMYDSVIAYRNALIDNADLTDIGGKLATWNTIYLYTYYNDGDTSTILENYYDGKKFKSNISFEDFIFIIAKHFPNVKYIDLEHFDKTNVTCGTITISNLGEIKRISDVLEKIYKDVSDNKNFSKFNFKNMFDGGHVALKRAIEAGCVYNGIIDPLINFDDYSNLKKNKYFIKYIENVMNENEIKIANDFIDAIKKLQKSGTKVSKKINFEVPHTIHEFINNITNITKEYGSNESIDNMVNLVINNYSNFKLMSSYLNYLKTL